jgi:uncharacterized membrane protein YhaH (DUF805 family)
MSGFDYFKKCFTQYADFRGRARRSEYWYFTLFSILLFTIPFILLIAGAIAMGKNVEQDAPVFSPMIFIGLAVVGIAALALAIPSLAVTARRLHDTGKTAWWYLISFVPFGSIVLLIFLCQDSEHGKNKWGRNPKEQMNNDFIDHLV